MTNREFLEAIATSEVSAELREFATSAIEKLNAKNEKRRVEGSKTAKENAPIKDAILGLLSEKPMVASEIAKVLEISTSKASALCGQLLKGEKVTAVEVKSGKSKVKEYHLA